MNEIVKNNGVGILKDEINTSDVPIIRSLMVLRKECFGGYMLNPYIPHEMKLDPIRFKIATLCNGEYSLKEIKKNIGDDLAHTKEYIDLMVETTIESFNRCMTVFWRKKKQKRPGQIRFSENDDSSSLTDHRHLSTPMFAIWEITKKCNLRCSHCLSDSGKQFPDELDTRAAKRVIDELEANKIFNLSLSGGEPLMRSDIFELLEYSSRKKIGVELLTNGTLITGETIDRLKNIRLFNVQISIDGIGDTHDNFRCSKGAYKSAVDAIRLLREAGYAVVVSTAVTRQNISQVSELIDMAVNLGVSAYKATRFMPAGRGSKHVAGLELTPMDAKKFDFMLINKKKEVGHKITINSEVIYPWLTNVQENTIAFDVEDTSKIGCTAGNSSLYITSDGKIVPCSFLCNYISDDGRTQALKEIRDIT